MKERASRTKWRFLVTSLLLNSIPLYLILQVLCLQQVTPQTLFFQSSYQAVSSSGTGSRGAWLLCVLWTIKICFKPVHLMLFAEISKTIHTLLIYVLYNINRPGNLNLSSWLHELSLALCPKHPISLCKNEDSFSIHIFQSLSFVNLCFIFLYMNYFSLVIVVTLACLSAG